MGTGRVFKASSPDPQMVYHASDFNDQLRIQASEYKYFREFLSF